MLGSAEEIGLSLVILTLVFACAALIRGWSRPLRALFIPTAVIGGFLIVALGPEGVGRLVGGTGIFSAETFAVWKALPGLLINVMCAALLLGEKLPSLKSIWSISGTHVIMAGIMSAGQFAVAASWCCCCWNRSSDSAARAERSSKCRSPAGTARWPA